VGLLGIAVHDYMELSTRREKFVPITVGLLALIIVSIWHFFFRVNADSFYDFSRDTITIILTVLAILAGFNITSIAILATANSPIIEHLRKILVKHTNKSWYRQLIVRFIWAVLVQIFLIIISIAYLVLSKSAPGYLISLFNIVLLLSISAATYALALTIQNLLLLYGVLAVDSKQFIGDHPAKPD